MRESEKRFPKKTRRGEINRKAIRVCLGLGGSRRRAGGDHLDQTRCSTPPGACSTGFNTAADHVEEETTMLYVAGLKSHL
jgi:hypothetical protein